MAFLTIAREAVSHAPSVGVVSRLWTRIMGAREAQAQYRVRSQLRDLSDDVLKDIGVPPHDLRRLRAGRPPESLLGP